MAENRTMRIVLGLALAVLVLAGGVGGFVFLLLTGIRDLSHDVTRMEAPGTFTVNLEQSGQYGVFLETFNQNGLDKDRLVETLMIEVSDSERNELIVKPVQSHQTYSFGPRTGVALFEFNVVEPGDYTLTATVSTEHDGNSFHLTLIRNFFSRLVRIIFISGGVLLAAFVLAALIVVFTLVFAGKRKDGRTQMTG